ncbi:MAG: HD domain-containing protein [Pseudomonadota bacterium]
MSDLVERARRYAIDAHRRIGHRRKYNSQPYDVHLKAVAEIVASVSDDDESIAAAWLHDTVEDTPATFADLEMEFGAALTQLVRELTDVSKPGDGNRALRKAIDREHLAGASPRAKTVKLADLIDNCRDICRHDPGFGKIYLGEARSLLEVLGEGDEGLMARAGKELQKGAQRLGMAVPQSTLMPGEDNLREALFPGAQQRVLRLFVEAFTAKDIAEPLISFDSEANPARVREVLESRQFTVAGVRRDGVVEGFIRLDDLRGGGDDLRRRAFGSDQVLSADASLSDVIHVLTRYEYCFVTLLGSPDAVITRAEIQKPVARMWLFGMITMIEINLAERIRVTWPDGSWHRLLSAARLRKTEELFEERRRRNQHTDLVDCLQLSDKAQVLMRSDEQLLEFGFASRSAARRAIKELESLRNNLAHAQDIVTHDWPQIARMTRRIELMAGH